MGLTFYLKRLRLLVKWSERACLREALLEASPPELEQKILSKTHTDTKYLFYFIVK